MITKPKLVAVLNITPDSFSGDGSSDPISRARQLIEEGADVLDVGAESTRPAATPLSADEEWQRLEPFWADLAALCKEHSIKLSLDTRHASTASKALQIGCDWINDVSGYTDEAMIEAVRESDCRLVVMHSLTVPVQKDIHLPEDTNMVAFMKQWQEKTIDRLAKAGIDKERLILDPGIGFGKTAQQSWELLKNTSQWRSNAPLLIGHSRKSYLSLFTDKPAAERDTLTRLGSAMLAAQGVGYLRVHDVTGHRQMFNML